MAATATCPKCGSAARVRSSWDRKLTGDRQVSMECCAKACRHAWLTLEPTAIGRGAVAARLRRA